MNPQISCDELAEMMASAQFCAVFDVRERGEYNDGQIPGATSLPRNQIEFRMADLVPDRRVQVVVYDEDGERAPLAAATLKRSGYEDVAILSGGLRAWRDAGRATASGVNVPSKAFGEKVHHERAVPEVTQEELKALAAQSADLLIVDVRTPEEYGRFCIPRGVNVPGGDLILWAEELKHRPEATVVVNCAGRTRSIVGTAALRRMGLANVRALRNGTMGWVLAGYDLERQPNRAGPRPDIESRRSAVGVALRIAEEEGLSWIAPEELSLLADTPKSMHYIIDVRSESEYGSGHVSGALNVPGGQAVQRADDFIAVRNAPIVFVSGESARAVMAAYWYRQMGYPNVRILRGGLRAWSERGGSLESGTRDPEPLGLESARAAAQWIDPAALQARRGNDSTSILDVGTSLEFETGHIPGACWIPRGWIERKLPEAWPDRERPIVVACPDGRHSVFGAASLKATGYENVFVLAGGVRAWAAAGFPLTPGVEGCLAERNDVVLSPSIRGSREDMQRYLDWELNLPK